MAQDSRQGMLDSYRQSASEIVRGIFFVCVHLVVQREADVQHMLPEMEHM